MHDTQQSPTFFCCYFLSVIEATTIPGILQILYSHKQNIICLKLQQGFVNVYIFILGEKGNPKHQTFSNIPLTDLMVQVCSLLREQILGVSYWS